MLNPVDEALIAGLHEAVPGAVRDPEARHLEEPRGRWRGQAGVLVAPKTAEEVAAVIRLAAEARVGVVPLGGGTGLVGGQILAEGPAPLVLSLERMSGVRAVYPEENVLVAGAGTTLAMIQEAAGAVGRLFPLSYASEGSARIGGALAVNSGGLNVLRYGTARDLCLGVEAVLPDGAIYRGLKRLRKDNTGYDLRNLLIGSEGTLGVITAASLRLVPRPARQAAAFLVVPGPAEALALLARAGRIAGEAVSAFELICGVGLDFVAETGLDARHPFAETPDWSVLIEIATSAESAPERLAETLFAEAMSSGEVTDGVLAQSEAQRTAFWTLRETIPEGNRRIGAVASHDIALPLGAVAEFIAEGARRIAKLGPFRINSFGHLGDGNLHYNMFPPKGGRREDWATEAPRVTETVHDLVAEMGGTFSAEHGVGRLKARDLEHYGDPAKLSAMRAIKSALDPLGIMNPGAVLRD